MIYFIRHGESEANLRNVFAGQKDDSVLSEKGREQAKATAQTIKSEIAKIDRIISSPLKRTRETADIVAREIGFDTDKIEIDSRIAEYDMGELTGTPIKVISSLIFTSSPGAENPDEFRNRVYSCIKELSQSEETILVVSHAGVGKVLETIKFNVGANLFNDYTAIPNASVHVVDWI